MLSRNLALWSKDTWKSIRKRFQFPGMVVTILPHPNEKAYSFAYGKVSFYKATFLCGLRFPVHPFIMQLLSILNVAPRQLIPNAWRMIIGCMSIWSLLPTMGILNFYLGVGSLGSFIVFLLLFVTGNHDTFLFLDLDGKLWLTTYGVRSYGCYGNGKFPLLVHSSTFLLDQLF